MKRDRLIWGLSCLYILTGISFFYYSNLMREKEQNLFTAMHKQNNDLYNLQITYLESSIISQYVIPPDSFLNRGEFVLVFPDNPCDACNPITSIFICFIIPKTGNYSIHFFLITQL